jgi:Na+/proline symporter
MASHGTDQLLVQRLLTCRDQRDSRRALIVSGFVVFAQFALFLTIGMMLHAYYATQPLPPIASNDEIFPAFIVRSLPSGIAGLVIAAVFAAAMSNLSGSLNSLASTSVLDFYQPLTGEKDDARLLRLSRWLTAVWGVVLMGIAVLARGWGSVFTVGLTIASIVYGPMLGAFLLGVLTTSTTERAVIAGIGVSLVAMIGVRVFTPLAWTWYVLAGTTMCMAVATVVTGFSRTRSPIAVQRP